MQPRHCLQPEQDEGQAVEVEAGWLKSVCHDGKKEQKPPSNIKKHHGKNQEQHKHNPE